MRGGFNVEPVDGELWTRRGIESQAGPAGRFTFASLPWLWIVQDPDSSKLFLVSHLHVVEYSASSNGVKRAVSASSEDITFSAGSDAATSTTTLSVNDMIFVGGGYTSECYRIVQVSGTDITLERNYEGSSGLKSCSVVNSFYGTASPAPSGVDAVGKRGNVGVIDQLVTHSLDDLYSGSPAVTAGDRYLLFAHEDLASPVAINLSTVGAPLGGNGTNWFRDTSLAAPAAVTPTAQTLTVVNNRAVFGHCGDASGSYENRTIWWSWPGDFLLWHVGLGGINAAPNYNTFDGNQNQIQQLLPLGRSLVVHREFSQEVGSPAGSATAPFDFSSSNRLGLGVVSPQAVTSVNQQHYLMSQNGPATFSPQQGVSLIGLAAESHFEAMKFWGRTEKVFADPYGMRVYFCGDDYQRHQDASVPAATLAPIAGTSNWDIPRALLVHDFGRGEWWFEDWVPVCSFGVATNGAIYAGRADGRIVQVDLHARAYISPYSGNTGFDADETASGKHVVDSLVDLPWMTFGPPGKRTMIRKIVVGLRSLDSDDAAVSSRIEDLWTSSSETLHFCTLSVFTDHNASTVQASADLNAVVSTMQALDLDENRQLPIMEFELTGPRRAAVTYKFRFANKLSAAATAAGHTQAHFRIAYVRVFVTGGDGDRLEAPAG